MYRKYIVELLHFEVYVDTEKKHTTFINLTKALGRVSVERAFRERKISSRLSILFEKFASRRILNAVPKYGARLVIIYGNNLVKLPNKLIPAHKLLKVTLFYVIFMRISRVKYIVTLAMYHLSVYRVYLHKRQRTGNNF